MTGRPDVVRVRIGDLDHDLTPQRSPFIIGREPPSGVVVANPLVSRRHAALVFEGGWLLRDLGSTNGTWHDGSRIRSTVEMRPGTVVRLGDPMTGVVVAMASNATVGPETPQGARRAGPPASTGPVGSRHHAAYVVGRDPAAWLPVADPAASWHHAELRQESGHWLVCDLGSTNQTLVNGSPVKRHPLRPGDLVLIGNTQLRWTGERLQPVDETGFVVDRASWDIKGRRIVNRVSFSIPKPALVALIGPSGAGKSSLLRLITGQTTPSEGIVTLDGSTLVSQREAQRGRIGVVPQHTVAHSALTARQVLSNAARLRLPADTGRAEIDRCIQASLDQLGLTAHADTRMSRLSGGQQRRVGIAMEMLTNPSMLILDEPTAGLDPSLVLQIMETLRGLADQGTRVLVVTHDLDHLRLTDEVIALRAGGTVAYRGPADDVFRHFGTSSWAETFAGLAVPDSTALGAGSAPPGPPRVEPVVLPAQPASARTSRRHLAVIAGRQVRLVATDPVYLALLVAMPVALAILALAVPGSDGLRPSSDPSSTEATRLLVILTVGAAFLGLSATIRDLVSERPIYRHESDAGLSPGAYLTAKVLVFTTVVMLQAVVLTGLVLTVRAGPTDAVVLGSPWLELAMAVAATAATGVALGLAVSSRVSTSEQAMPPLVLLVMTQLVLCGGLFPVDGRGVLPVLSGLLPTRWGYAAAASTTDLNNTSTAVDPDSLWAHTASNFIGCLLVLAMIWMILVLLARWGVRRRTVRR